MILANLFTGFLGVGKTTALIHLLEHKTDPAPWAVLINEFGEVGIDAALVEGQGTRGVSVREISGGCVCCTTAPELPVALHFLLTETKPSRLLIETTGLGHPARILDTIRRNYADRIELRATVGLVAPQDVTCPGMFENPIFMDQVHLADVLVLNKQDLATQEQFQAFTDWANDCFPPKLLIAATTRGVLDPAWLDIVPTMERVARYPEAHRLSSAETPGIEAPLLELPTPGRPIRLASPGEINACGWLFSIRDRFVEDQLLELIQRTPALTRLKGVFQVDGECIAVNRAPGTTTVRVVAYRRDSRLEAFASDPGFDWLAWEQSLLACLVQPRG